MKKVLAIVLSLVMVLSLATVAFASYDSDKAIDYNDVVKNDKTAGAETGLAWYEMPVAYVVTYPDEIEVNGAAATLTIKEAYVEYGAKVTVDVDSTDWKLANNDDTVDYVLTDSLASKTNGNIQLVFTPSNADSHTIATDLTATATETDFGYAGYYTDELTYTITYVAAP